VAVLTLPTAYYKLPTVYLPSACTLHFVNVLFNPKISITQMVLPHFQLPCRSVWLGSILLLSCLFQREAAAQRNDTLVLNPNILIQNVIGDRFLLRQNYPDTLLVGGFTLIVERYTSNGTWNPRLNTYTGLSGYGRVKFNCQRNFFPWGVLWNEAIFKPLNVTIAETIRNPQREISIRDARQLGIEARIGQQVELQVPHLGDRAVDLVGYLNDRFNPAPEGIRVQFTNASVRVPALNARRGSIIVGDCTYPTDPPVPQPPVNLNVAPGFQLQIDSLTIGPLRTAAVAKLVLPNSLTAGTECRAATLNLGTILINANCEFYKELLDSTFAFGVGNTTLNVQGRGFVADFSSTQTYAPSGKPLAWKGVFLLAGASAGTASGVVSNIGYLQARYNFTAGLVESTGLFANFNCNTPYRYNTTVPADYTVGFNQAQIRVEKSAVVSGNLNTGTLVLPKRGARDRNANLITLTDIRYSINDRMDVRGSTGYNQSVYWGDLVSPQELLSFGMQGAAFKVSIFFAAQYRNPYFPLDATGTGFQINPTGNDSLQGATFLFTNGQLSINARDVPVAWSSMPPAMSPHLNLTLRTNELLWINVVTEGVHCHINSPIWDQGATTLGNPADALYVGKTPFQTIFSRRGQRQGSIRLQCVESAVFECDVRGIVNLPQPTGSTFAFKEMCFTSSARNAGGKVDLGGGGNDSLSYWGLALVQKPGFTSAGLVSVRTGQIVMTAAGLTEPRHFTQPFYVTWGELLANGEVGRLFFDYNSAGQQFDKFHFVTSGVALSPYNPADRAFLRVGGMAHFPFFGGDYLHIKDFYVPAQAAAPFNTRSIELSNETLTGFTSTDFSIAGNWYSGLADFAFTLAYDAVAQNGFTGVGTGSLRYLAGGAIGSTLTMNDRGTCMRIGTNLLDQRSVALGPVANVSNITRIWGCACVVNDQLANVVVGGELTNAANMSILARAGSTVQTVLQITPSTAKITMDGEAYVSLAAAVDVMVNGHIQLLMDFGRGILEGEVAGEFRNASGALLVGNSLEGRGEANWHLGSDYQSIQGMLELRVMGISGGSGFGAGFYVGANAPKEKAWVLIGSDPRYALNMTVLPARLTGVYGYVHIRRGVNLYIVSGEYELFVGLGAFVTPLPTVVGNLGGRIHGEILGGLVSAGARFNMQVAVGPPCGLGFQGTVGLEGCALWVFCGSVDVTMGLNGCEGFYVR
jgi:hypothetical protein